MGAPDEANGRQPTREAEATTAGATRRRRLLKSPWLHLVLAVVLVALVQGFLVKVYQIPSGSMEQTLNVGDRVLVNRTAYVSSTPRGGDVVVFRRTAAWGPSAEHNPLRTAVGWFGDLTGIGPGNTEYLVKRVIGVPGDTVSCCDAQGRVIVNGKAIDEPYIYQDLPFAPGVGREACTTQSWSPRCFTAVTLGADQYLVLGDHRSDSSDSVAACRTPGSSQGCARTVTREEMIGTVAGFLYPFDKWGQGVE